MIEEDSVRFAHSGPSQRFLRGLRPLVSVGPLPLYGVRGWTRLLNHYYPPSDNAEGGMPSKLTTATGVPLQ